MSTSIDGEKKYYVVKSPHRKSYHTDINCKRLNASGVEVIETTDIRGLSLCYWCGKRHQKSTIVEYPPSLGRITRVEIPIWCTSDGQEFGDEVNSLRHELELCMSRIVNLTKQLESNHETEE